MTGKLTWTFLATPWRHDAGWFFVTVPGDLSAEIRQLLQQEEQGWGRLKAIALIAGVQWETAIWFDTKQRAYLLPLKQEIRKKARIGTHADVKVTLLL